MASTVGPALRSELRKPVLAEAGTKIMLDLSPRCFRVALEFHMKVFHEMFRLTEEVSGSNEIVGSNCNGCQADKNSKQCSPSKPRRWANSIASPNRVPAWSNRPSPSSANPKSHRVLRSQPVETVLLRDGQGPI